MLEGPKEEKKEESPEEETRRNLAFLLEKVEGCSVSVSVDILTFYHPILHFSPFLSACYFFEVFLNVNNQGCWEIFQMQCNMLHRQNTDNIRYFNDIDNE